MSCLGVTFCEQISTEEFDRQNLEASEQALMKLVCDVIDNTNLMLEEKIKWLERFKAEYPRLYEKHFKHIRW
ncbi:unnamed protein product [Soboliphyme baturini]|uniref:DDE_Tnp_ISL3 domain-containing protein n=1 Tax=Soboliphyme baturini TaxID=241478 RepID=A0A183JAE7_9BILA|nr:unnamed protein product [Soboliphyme baturini]